MKKAVIALASLVFVTQVAIANAQSVTEGTAVVAQTVTQAISVTPVQKATSDAQLQRDSLAAETNQVNSNKCTDFSTMETAKSEQFQTLNQQVSTIQDKLQAIVSTFQSLGQDTTQLQTAITSFQAAATVCMTNQQAYLQSISAVKERACVDQRIGGDVLRQALSARQLRQEGCREMRNVFVEQVKPAVVELRDTYRTSIAPTPETNPTITTVPNN